MENIETLIEQENEMHKSSKSYRILTLLTQLQERLEYRTKKQYCAEYNIQLKIKDAIYTEFCELMREIEELKAEIKNLTQCHAEEEDW